MKELDRMLLDIYKTGWNYELKTMCHLEKKAFDLGRAHAIAGDDVSSIDLLSEEDILREIKG